MTKNMNRSRHSDKNVRFPFYIRSSLSFSNRLFLLICHRFRGRRASRKLRFRTCRMRNDNRRNMELLHVSRKKTFPYVFLWNEASSAHTTHNSKGNKKSPRKSSNMKEINEVIKVKENPFNVILESQTNKQTAKSFHIFFPPHNIFQLFVCIRNKSFFLLLLARQPSSLVSSAYKQRMKTQQHPAAGRRRATCFIPEISFWHCWVESGRGLIVMQIDWKDSNWWMRGSEWRHWSERTALSRQILINLACIDGVIVDWDLASCWVIIAVWDYEASTQAFNSTSKFEGLQMIPYYGIIKWWARVFKVLKFNPFPCHSTHSLNSNE